MKKEEHLSYMFHEINKIFIGNVKKELNSLGINPSFRFVFMCLQNKEEVIQSDICCSTHYKASSISLLLKQMESEGLILREKSKNDSRKTIVKLTKEGKALDKKLQDVFGHQEEILESTLSQEEMKAFKERLKVMICNLKGVE